MWVMFQSPAWGTKTTRGLCRRTMLAIASTQACQWAWSSWRERGLTRSRPPGAVVATSKPRNSQAPRSSASRGP